MGHPAWQRTNQITVITFQIGDLESMRIVYSVCARLLIFRHNS
jgi:hypothetical protein